MNMTNEKKEYVSPEMEILTLAHQANLLDGSECDPSEENCGESG